MVNADNTFSRLNRKAALHNIQQICPPIHTYLLNHYQAPANLVVNSFGDSSKFNLNSEEGCTQGDAAATAFYALGVKPLIDNLASTSCHPEHCKQSWYADDSAAAGRLINIKAWWDTLNQLGPKYGYFPNPVLFIKNQGNLKPA